MLLKNCKFCYGVITLMTVTCVLSLTTEESPGRKNSYIRSNILCEPDHLTVYRVSLTTYWNNRSFPKHFPQWRPPAQWSKLIGRSHNKSYILFRLGGSASEGLKMFAEDGRSDTLDAQSQGEGGVYDEFNAPPIYSGEGKTEAEFFVDGNHSRVSLISKMVPSPDWFIGIDGFDLCINGKWLDRITIEVDPVDAGVDNGFTFTAPNWPTEPRGVIYRLTSSFPNHPASSWFYPSIKKLPPIASFQFTKVKEYELSGVFHHSEDSFPNEVLKMEQISYVYEEGEGNSLILKKNVSNHLINHLKLEAKYQDLPNNITSTEHIPTTWNYKNNINSVEKEKDTAVKKQKDVKIMSDNLKEKAVVKNILNIYSKKKPTTEAPEIQIYQNSVEQVTKKMKSKLKTHRKEKDVRKMRLPRDCQVGEWSEWTMCSKTCDIGESTRVRKVVHHARRGGRPCPPLFDKKWCGSARSCNRRYFNWSK